MSDAPGPSIGTQLSSVSTALNELTERIGSLAENARDDVAGSLFEVERSLATASRRLEQLVNDLT